MAQRLYFPKLISSTMAIFVLSNTVVSSLPVVSKDLLPEIFGLTLHVGASAFICYQISLLKKFVAWIKISWAAGLLRKCLKVLYFLVTGTVTRLELREDAAVNGVVGIAQAQQPYTETQNYLGYLFFTGYVLTQGFRAITGLHLVQNAPECITYFGLCYETIKILYASLLMYSMTHKGTSKPHWPFVSYIGWAFVAMVNFTEAIKCILQNAIFAYVLYCERTVIPPSTISDLMAPIVETIEECTAKSLAPTYVNFVTEFNGTFGTEFYSLATLCSVFNWKKLEHHDNSSGIDSNDIIIDWDDAQDPTGSHQCTRSCAFAIPANDAYLWISLVGIVTVILVSYYIALMNSGNYFGGLWVTCFQNLVLEGGILSLESSYYFYHLRKMEGTTFKVGHDMDLLLLIFPLVPFGIDYALLDLPHMSNTLLGSRNTWILALIYITFQWVQVAFQGIFVAEVLTTKNKTVALRQAKYLFLVLSAFNFYMWLSWTVECPLRAVHGFYTGSYGVPTSILIVYSTLPFIYFSMAHVSAVFLELFFELKKSEEVDPS